MRMRSTLSLKLFGSVGVAGVLLLTACDGGSSPESPDNTGASADDGVSGPAETDATATTPQTPTLTGVLSEDLGEYPDGRVQGTLIAEVVDGDVYLLLEAENGDLTGLIFPPSYEVSMAEGTVTLKEGGENLAEEQEHVTFGGGAYPQGESLWSDGPEHDSLAIVAPSS